MPTNHQNLDERSLAFGKAIAQKLHQQPELIQAAQANLSRWIEQSDPRSRPALEEWQVILNQPLQKIIEVLVSNSERSIRLRQSNPFAGVLSPQERNQIILQFAASA